jgi:predicted phage terminase large subunit-like protein
MRFSNPSLRLPTIEELKEKGEWFDTYEEQVSKRNLMNDIVRLNETIALGKPLSEKQLILRESLGMSPEKAQAIAEDKYFTILSRMAKHNLAAYHEFINPQEVPAAHHRYVCDRLEALERREIRMLILSLPPGSAKSSYASRSFIQWYLGRNPHHKILSGGYNMRFVENEFSKPNRAVLTSPEYRQVFPDVEIDPSFRGASLWAIANFGGRYNVRAVGAGTSGIRADLIVLDDIIAGAKVAQSPTELANANNWVTGDVLPRRLPNAVILIIGTRWHSDDPLGFLEKMVEESPELMPEPAEIINISAMGGPDNPFAEEGHWLWEEFYGKKHYITQKATMEPGIWSATYLGIPLDQQGFYIKEEEIKRYDELPKGEMKVTLSIDTAQKSTENANRTAIVAFAKDTKTNVHYVIDAWAGRESLLLLIDRIGKMVQKHGASSIYIEDAAMGSQILENYAQAFPCPLIAIIPQQKGTKQFNFDTFLVPMLQAGTIQFPRNKDWVADIINEIVAFPGILDDYCDAASQYARKVTRKRSYGTKRAKTGL